MHKKGRLLVEYILIIILVFTIVIGIINSFKDYIKDFVTYISCIISNHEYIVGEEVGKGYCK